MVDPMKVAIKVAASGIEAQSRRMLVVSENLANANSTGKTPGRRSLYAQDDQLRERDGRGQGRAPRQSRPRRSSTEAPFRIEHDPSHPAADAKGYVKMPNVDMLVELADMREANRSYEANLQVVKQARSLISMTIDLLRSQ